MDLLPIGEVARRSGLSVSSLRFYDGEAVLQPEAVDAATGYRRYAPEQVRTARLVAGLRRIGMPLAEIREAVEHPGDGELISDLLDAHLTRLETGLADARREIDRLRTVFANVSAVAASAEATAQVHAADLSRLIEAVRFAIGDDPETPALHGALLEIEEGRVRMVATDRYRLAVHEVEARTSGAGSGVMPLRGLDDLAELAERAESESGGTGGRRTSATNTQAGLVEMALDALALSAWAGRHRAHSALLEADYPDYRRILTDDRDTDMPWDDGMVRVGVPTPELATLSGEGESIVVRHEFLLEALAAAGARATLRLDGPIAPLAIRAPDGALSLLMPTRPEVER